MCVLLRVVSVLLRGSVKIGGPPSRLGAHLSYLPLAGSTQLARTCTVSSLLFCRLMLATLATPTSITLAMVSMHIESESAAQVYARCVRAAIKTANERRPRDVQPQQSNSGAAAEKQRRSSAQQAEVVCTGR